NYNAQVEHYRKEVRDIKENVTTLEKNKADITYVNKEFMNMVGVNINDYGTNGKAIKTASEKHSTVIFPEGTYTIDEFTEIKNNQNLTWVAVGKVTILDTTKNIKLVNEEIGETANGLKFT